MEHILRVEQQARVADDAVAHGERIVQHSRRAAVAADNLEALVGGGVDEIRGALVQVVQAGVPVLVVRIGQLGRLNEDAVATAAQHEQGKTAAVVAVAAVVLVQPRCEQRLVLVVEHLQRAVVLQAAQARAQHAHRDGNNLGGVVTAQLGSQARLLRGAHDVGPTQVDLGGAARQRAGEVRETGDGGHLDARGFGYADEGPKGQRVKVDLLVQCRHEALQVIVCDRRRAAGTANIDSRPQRAVVKGGLEETLFRERVQHQLLVTHRHFWECLSLLHITSVRV